MARNNLVKNHITTGHILAVQIPEKVPGRVPHGCMTIHVFDNVSDIHHAVIATPIAKPLAKTLAVEGGNNIHVGRSDSRCLRAHVKPQCR